MKEFLEPLEFRMHKRDLKTEWVANKIFPFNNLNYIIRIYTTINPEDVSRGVGTDAIRVGVFTSKGEWVFGTKRVNRTKNWKKSIQQRIQELEERLNKQLENYKCAECV
jgi:hypothetical protein